MRVKRTILPALSLCGLVALCAAALALVQSSTLSGRVTLQTGAAVPGSMVKLYYPKGVNKPTLVTYTNAQGAFNFDSLDAGRYLLEVYTSDQLVYQKVVSVPSAALAIKLERADPNKITVQYFPKESDRDAIESALRDLGGRYTLNRGRTEVGDTPTNTLWFGPNVSLEDIKRVASALVNKGVQLRAIRPFKSVTGSNGLLIQIGAFRGAMSAQLWSADRIQNVRDKSEFTR